jgi:hypothetical protein
MNPVSSFPALVLSAALAVLGGCADTSSNWPSATDFSRISQKVLTPQEQQKEIDGLSEEQKAAEKRAIRRIETTR